MKWAQGRRRSSVVKHDQYSIPIKLYNCCLYQREKSKQIMEENIINELIQIAFPGSKFAFSKDESDKSETNTHLYGPVITAMVDKKRLCMVQ